MRTLVLGICITIASTVSAQRYCVTTDYIQQIHLSDPSSSLRIQQTENFIRQQLLLQSKTEEENIRIIRIPVVVHILYNNNAQNISDAQVQSQIDVLNRDFRRLNSDTGSTPSRFKSMAADVQIEFALATADPEGRPTNGIVRRQTNIAYWGTDDKIKMNAQGGNDPWNTSSYLNIWVGNLRSLLGYSSVPGSDASRDGLVINYTAFGTFNTSAPYNLGRTTVHEVGHWLGLKHIWGDTYCGDDGVDDTPTQGNFTAGCPNGFRSSCSNGATGDMYMNYMDYTDDACVNLFTIGQKNRMMVHFNEGAPRQSLLLSKGLSLPWKEPAPVPVPASYGMHFYPNPAGETISVQFESFEKWLGQNITIINLNGSIVAGAKVNGKSVTLNLSSLQRGMYFIQVSNGKEKLSEKFFRL